MSFNRVTLVALATFFTIGMTSLASAGCCDWGYSAPVVYVPVAPVSYGGCGGCGGPTVAAVYAQPVAPAPIIVSASIGSPFGGPCCGGGGCGNCGGWAISSGGCGGCGAPVAYAEPSPQLYVVNQGPEYSGPGLTVPYATYSPEAAYAPATDYPYVPGYGYGRPAYPHYYTHRYYGGRYAFHSPVYMHPRYYGGGARYNGGAHWGHYYR
jgi:hypothetical protein